MGKLTWTIESSTDKEYIIERAKMLGWLDTPQRVQVKRYEGMEIWYLIEPFEEDCSCPDLIQPPKESKMLDKDKFEDIENRMQEVHSEGRELTECEKDREFLYLYVLDLVNSSILDLFKSTPVPNTASTEG